MSEESFSRAALASRKGERSVHSSALIEALRNVYDAGFLADEIAPPADKLGKKRAAR